MGKRIIRISIWVLICLLCISSWILGRIAETYPPKWHNPAQIGNPYLFTDNKYYWGSITDYIVANGRFYLLYGSKDILQCFDLSGKYLYSYSIPYYQNGRTELYTDGNKMFLEDKRHNLYVFSETGFETFYPYDDTISAIRSGFYKKANCNTTEDGSFYQLRWASIYRTNPDGTSKIVIQRPFWMAIFQNHRIDVFRTFLWLLIVLKVILIKRRQGIN